MTQATVTTAMKFHEAGIWVELAIGEQVEVCRPSSAELKRMSEIERNEGPQMIVLWNEKRRYVPRKALRLE